MKRACVVIFGLLMAMGATGQIRLNTLRIKAKQVYEIKETDILVVDSLIMEDSSRLILNHLKAENFIHAKAAVFYRGCVIDGKGVRGIPGRKGRAGYSPPGPCTDGKPGLMGSNGTNGGKGINLSLYLSDIAVRGTLVIDVSGGDGGDGGTGGVGGGGAPGTRLCNGGNGGQGGNGANGGNGGDGGAITFIAPRIPELRSLIGEKILVRTYGGNLGLGGDGGAGGYSGLSPTGDTKLEGKTGKKGQKGNSGSRGITKAVNFQDK